MNFDVCCGDGRKKPAAAGSSSCPVEVQRTSASALGAIAANRSRIVAMLAACTVAAETELPSGSGRSRVAVAAATTVGA